MKKKRTLSAFLIFFTAVIISLSALAYTGVIPLNNIIGDIIEKITVSETETTLEETTEPTTKKEITLLSKVKLRCGGDVLIHVPIYTSAKTSSGYNFDFLFSNSASLFNEADFFIGNLETTFGGRENGRNYSGFPRFNTPDELASALKKSGFDLMLTANNHTFDTNGAGVLRTQDVLKKAGLPYTGTRKTEGDKKYFIKNLSGIKLGFINYTYETDSSEGRKSLNGLLVDEKTAGLINSFHFSRTEAFLKELEGEMKKMKKEGAEKIILFLHWGEEYRLEPTTAQKELASKLCDLGVDVLIGGHPHVVEPVELIKGSSGKRMICVYSLGNFVSNQRREYMGLKTGHTEDGLVFELEFSKYSDGTVLIDSVRSIPIWVHLYSENGRKIYNPIPLKSKMDENYLTLKKSPKALSLARESYERTMALVKEGTKECNVYLSSQKRPVNS